MTLYKVSPNSEVQKVQTSLIIAYRVEVFPPPLCRSPQSTECHTAFGSLPTTPSRATTPSIFTECQMVFVGPHQLWDAKGAK